MIKKSDIAKLKKSVLRWCVTAVILAGSCLIKDEVMGYAFLVMLVLSLLVCAGVRE